MTRNVEVITLRMKKVQKFQPGIWRWFSDLLTSSDLCMTAESNAAMIPSFILRVNSAHAGGVIAP